MPVVVDATVGGVSANCYCTQAEADTYHTTHPYAAVWTGATLDQQNRAIVTATRLLDEMVVWDGWVQNQQQALLWPRVGMYAPNGFYIPNDTIPVLLKNAVAEFARQLIAIDRTADNDAETQGLESMVVGGTRQGVEMTFKNPTAKVIPDAVFHMVSRWGRIRSRANSMVPLVRA